MCVVQQVGWCCMAHRVCVAFSWVCRCWESVGKVVLFLFSCDFLGPSGFLSRLLFHGRVDACAEASLACYRDTEKEETGVDCSSEPRQPSVPSDDAALEPT
jgi:hypothetical protein